MFDPPETIEGLTPSKAHPGLLALAALGLLILGAACRGPLPGSGSDDPEPSPRGQLVSEAESLLQAELMQADREFAESVRTGRLDSWVAAFDDEGMVLPADGPIAAGREAIRDLFSPLFAEPSFDMTWVPAGSAVAASGDMGYTFGEWTTSTRTPGGDLEHGEGKYVTVWRKGADGRWRVVADIGNRRQEPAAGN